MAMSYYKDDTWFFDMEVLPHDWILCALHMNGEKRKFFHNNAEGLYEFLNGWTDGEVILCGYNAKGYDIHIVRAICGGATPEECKELSDSIVNGANPWSLDLGKIPCPYYDLMLDLPQRQSLKMIEGNLKMDIVESSVGFDTEYPTEEEMASLVEYCWHDVEALVPLWEYRKKYLEAKETLAMMMRGNINTSLSKTNAQLTAQYLKARAGNYSDPTHRVYVYPENLDLDYIPAEVKEFFDKYNDNSISSEELFSKTIEEEVDGEIRASKNPNKNREVLIGDCPSIVAWGGIHGALPNYREESDDKRIILNYDVASYYPSLMIQNHYLSRAVVNPAEFEEVFHTRIDAKRNGDKETANALKLVLNTTYGASNAKFNPLYDPDMAHSVCISGQLYLTELATKLKKYVPSLRVVQLNTDGIMVSCDIVDVDSVDKIVEKWSNKTGFGMEKDTIQCVVQKDVNNYVVRMADGAIKCKGGFLNVYGKKDEDRFTSNSLYIVAKAIIDYLLDGVPVEETINKCDDPFLFQKIDKTGGTFDGCWYETIDEE